MAARARGAVSNNVTVDGGRSASDRTLTPVSMVPPSERSRLARESVIERDPPAATGHPTW